MLIPSIGKRRRREGRATRSVPLLARPHAADGLSAMRNALSEQGIQIALSLPSLRTLGTL